MSKLFNIADPSGFVQFSGICLLLFFIFLGLGSIAKPTDYQYQSSTVKGFAEMMDSVALSLRDSLNTTIEDTGAVYYVRYSNVPVYIGTPTTPLYVKDWNDVETPEVPFTEIALTGRVYVDSFENYLYYNTWYLLQTSEEALYMPHFTPLNGLTKNPCESFTWVISTQSMEYFSTLDEFLIAALGDSDTQPEADNYYRIKFAIQDKAKGSTWQEKVAWYTLTQLSAEQTALLVSNPDSLLQEYPF